MIFSRPLTEIVQRRRSCRTFLPQTVEQGTLDLIREGFLPPPSPLPPPSRFTLLDRRDPALENLSLKGSYGLIRNDRFFLTASLSPALPHSWEGFGFALERSVLQMTDVNLGSCWLGGIFDRSALSRYLGLQEGESIPAVIALGLPAQDQTLRDRILRWSSKGDQRKPWPELFFLPDGAPLPPEESGPWREALSNLRLAPSASNKQPWRALLNGKSLHLFLRRDPLLDSLRKRADLQALDMGIALCHLWLTLEEGGLFPSLAATPVPPPPSHPEWEYRLTLSL